MCLLSEMVTMLVHILHSTLISANSECLEFGRTRINSSVTRIPLDQLVYLLGTIKNHRQSSLAAERSHQEDNDRHGDENSQVFFHLHLLLVVFIVFLRVSKDTKATKSYKQGGLEENADQLSHTFHSFRD